MPMFIGILAALLLLAQPAFGQAPVRVCNSALSPSCINPNSDGSINTTSTVSSTGKTTTQAKVTVAATNTYQTGLAASSTRAGCTIQYVAVAGTKGYVYFGSAPADTTTSFQLTNGQSLSCAVGGVAVATDIITITATQNDIFIVSNQ